MKKTTRSRLSQSDDGYAMVLTMMIILIVGAMVVTVLTSTQRSLAASKRSGDSANALQVADAGINAAVRQITDFTGSTAGAGPHIVIDESLSGDGDRYRVEATKLSTCVWSVISTGSDSSGVTRQVRATSMCEPKFANALFAQSTVDPGAGVAVDSYSGGLTQAQTCTNKGTVGTNKPEDNDLNVAGAGGGVRNCTQQLPLFSTNPKGYVFDKCIGYGDPPKPFKNEDDNDDSRTCGTIEYVQPSFPFDDVTVPTVPSANNLGAFVCNSARNLAPGKYVASSIVLSHNCRIPNSTATQHNAVEIYTAGSVNIGDGNDQHVNAPAPGCTGTSPTGNDLYSGADQSPLSYYCPGWAGSTQIYVGGSGKVNFANHVRFFGVVWAPKRELATTGGGASGGGAHPLIWGAIAGSSVKPGAQMAIHFDEGLSTLSSGRFNITAWREKR